MAAASPLDGTQRRHWQREIAVSAAINAALSALFAFLVFGRRQAIELWGMDGLAFDFVPQSFVIGFMAALVPSLLTRAKMRRGDVRRAPAPGLALPRNVALRALLFGIAATVICGGVATLALAAVWTGPISFAQVLPLKIVYGAAVAMLVTTVAVRAALADAAEGSVRDG